MGWSSGYVDGEWVGYAHFTECGAEGCTISTSKGLDQLCGDMHGSAREYGCGKYFCPNHQLTHSDECYEAYTAWEENLYGDPDEESEDAWDDYNDYYDDYGSLSCGCCSCCGCFCYEDEDDDDNY